jgi:hypothetical protein
VPLEVVLAGGIVVAAVSTSGRCRYRRHSGKTLIELDRTEERERLWQEAWAGGVFVRTPRRF